MAAFNANDPKYFSCCCGAHITKLSRVLIVISLVFYSLQLFTRSHHAIAGLLITLLGAFAVFQEMRIPLLVYILMMILHFIIAVTHGLLTASWLKRNDPEYREYEVLIPLLMVAYFIVSFFVLVLFLMTYRNLAEYIKDRENASRSPEIYRQPKIEKQEVQPSQENTTEQLS